MNKLYFILLFILTVAFSGNGQETLRLTADDCRQMALDNSRRLRRSELAVRQAELDRKVADISRLPNLQGSATGIYMFPDIDMMGMKTQMRGAYMAGLQITQPIYAGGKITAGRHLAKIGEKVSSEQLRMDRMDVVEDAMQSYWTLVAVRDKVRLAKQYHAMIDTVYDQTSAAVSVGLATENDLLRIVAKRSEIAYQVKKAENGAELCRMALCNAIGAEYSSQIIPLDSIPVVAEPGLLDSDISRRPELALLRHGVEASKEQVKLTLGDFLPTVGLSLGYNWYGNIKLKGFADVGNGMMVPYTQKFQDNLGMAVLALQVPLFHWGEGAKKVKKAKLEVERAQLDLEEKSRLLELEARQAALNLEDGWSLIATSELALRQADENLRVMQERYNEGMATLNDLLDAQNQWQQAHSDRIEAATQYQIHRIAWLRATGTL